MKKNSFSIIILTIIITSLLMTNTTVLAEEKTIQISPTISGLLWSDYTFGDCCSMDSINLNPSTMSIYNCGTMGGYCSAGKRVALWVFKLPEIPENSTINSTNFLGRISGSSGSGLLKTKSATDGNLSVASGLNTWTYPHNSQTVLWPSGLFTMPINIDQAIKLGHDYIFVSGYKSSNMMFYNSGTNEPTLEINIDIQDVECTGDFNSDEQINVIDVLQLINAFGNCSNKYCEEDIDEDSNIGVTDLLLLLSAWGPCD